MSDEQDTTTVEVKIDTWAALDRRKERGDTFDDVIRRLIDATPVGMGQLKEVDQPLEYGDVQPLDADDDPEKSCAEYDIISGEACDKDVEYKQAWRYEDEEEWSWFYYCPEHTPEIGQ
jgi:hypothetical protein